MHTVTVSSSFSGGAGDTVLHPENRSLARTGGSRAVMGDAEIRGKLDRGILAFFRDALKVTIDRPRWWVTALRLFLSQRRSARNRKLWLDQNVAVPPFMILSVTNRCNLKCAGCYAKALHGKNEEPLSTERLEEILSEAGSLGISTVLIVGGEPLTRRDIFTVTGRFRSTVFALFTNGTLLDGAAAGILRDQRNVIPVLSIEGNRIETDCRRGEGVFSSLESAMALLRKNDIFFGCSVTVTRNNCDTVLDTEWIRRLNRQGCRLFIFVEYVPVDQGSESLALTERQRGELIATTAALRTTFRSLFLTFPGDEDEFGGCLAAGRGFIHISPSGDLEPCPFAPYSDRNVKEASLKRALRSPLLEKIRANHSNLQETAGGCSLWAEREWVASLLGENDSKKKVA